MITYDTDVFTEILLNTPEYSGRATQFPRDEQSLPIVVATEILQGRLNSIRKAESGKTRLTIVQAYHLFSLSVANLSTYKTLQYTAAAHDRFQQWRKAKVRVGTNDLRIAAIAIEHDALLITRNSRDYAQVPGLRYEIWN